MRWIPAFAGTTMGEESSNLRLIEIFTLLFSLPEREGDSIVIKKVRKLKP